MIELLIKKNRVGIDIGGTLTKLVFYIPEDFKIDLDESEVTEVIVGDSKITLYMKKWDS